ncbi:MAG TPA: alpha/beta hydrolase [Dehalococcoidia bacterium]|nr:alpha/beta hydrolase [Dehalococcoidia bacterium]
MPSARVNGVELAFEEAGSGFPLVWCHEFAGSMESWEPQVHFFARRYRVITYNARGYPSSEVPADPEAYSQDIAVEDLYQLLRHLGVDQAHVGGLSMGGATALHFGIRHPEMARALIVAAAGSGSTNPEQFRDGCLALARRLEAEGMAALSDYALGPSRLQLKRKDPLGYQQFVDQLMRHSARGSANTMRGVQAARPPIFAWEKELQALRAPALILVGDEDAACVEPALFMKRHIPSSGLAFLPQSGHAINLEEPDLFNRLVLDFLTAAEAGKWATRA